MTGLTDYITQCSWEDIFTAWFVWVDDLYKQLQAEGLVRRERGPRPRMADSEVITIGLICDTFFSGKEELTLCFMRQHYLSLFPDLLEESRFNRRRRSLGRVIEEIRRRLSVQLIAPADRLRLVDTAPVPVCTYMRGNRCQTVRGAEYCGVIPSKRAKFFGFRLHLTSSWDHVVEHWVLAPASFRETVVLEALTTEQWGLTLVGDQGFQSAELGAWLKESRELFLQTARRRTDRVQWPEKTRQLLNRARRRIETAISVLSTVFHIEHPGSRSLSGLVARIATRILAYTLSFISAKTLLPQTN